MDKQSEIGGYPWKSSGQIHGFPQKDSYFYPKTNWLWISQRFSTNTFRPIHSHFTHEQQNPSIPQKVRDTDNSLYSSKLKVDKP